MAAIEGGAAAPSLVEAVRTREAEIARLRAALDDLSEPVQEKLAVMPTWVRQQLDDAASLLAETPERTKREFMRLGVSFTLHPVHLDGQRPFLRAEGTSAIAQLIAGQHSSLSTGDATHPQSVQNRTRQPSP